ncbi:MAG: hydantoinase/oxoprolinase family protein, partial [Deltaproteobacteria bacterium]|nr:hydantoinase/oxoprolinase family protein [Deltaproteobacteria bacterium]
GGPFTDITVLLPSGELVVDKAPTVVGDFASGVLNAIAEAARDLGQSPQTFLDRVTFLKHGTTVGTNALITRSGSRVGFITTRGFEDTTLVMRAIGRVDGLSEDEIKHFAYVTKPDPLVPRELIRGVSERVDFRGNVVAPLRLDEAREAIRSLVEEAGVDALAVSLLFGWVNPVHEQIVKRLLGEMYPDRDIFCTLAHELVPVVREYARANTVIVNAYLGRTMRDYVGQLDRQLRTSGFGGQLMIMQANGGIVSVDQMTPIGTLSSGPAGGIIASKFIADLLGHANVISTDMGGTSFDVGLITDGFWEYAPEPIVSRFRLLQPMIQIESIGAGGGTMARVEASTGRLLVGPESAGASPGPACYDTGGTVPTVTDADLMLGYLDPDYFLGGRKRLDRARAEAAIAEQIARPMGVDVITAAAGIHDVINAKMSDLIRKQVVRAGHLPEEFVLYAFGGAGPVHAAGFGGELEVSRIYVFPTSAVFSAFGIAAADVIHTRVSSSRYFFPVDPGALNRRLEELEGELMAQMGKEGFRPEAVAFRRVFHMRYRRQMNELAVEVPGGLYDEARIEQIMALFERRYEETFGRGSSYREAGIELISIAVDAIARTPKPRLQSLPVGGEDPEPARRGMRETFFAGTGRCASPVYDFGRLRPGNRLRGPAIVDTPITTVVLPPRWQGTVDGYANILLEKEHAR